MTSQMQTTALRSSMERIIRLPHSSNFYPQPTILRKHIPISSKFVETVAVVRAPWGRPHPISSKLPVMLVARSRKLLSSVQRLEGRYCFCSLPAAASVSAGDAAAALEALQFPIGPDPQLVIAHWASLPQLQPWTFLTPLMVIAHRNTALENTRLRPTCSFYHRHDYQLLLETDHRLADRTFLLIFWLVLPRRHPLYFKISHDDFLRSINPSQQQMYESTSCHLLDSWWTGFRFSKICPLIYTWTLFYPSHCRMVINALAHPRVSSGSFYRINRRSSRHMIHLCF